MQVKLIRKPSKGKSTLGELFVDGKFECYTLEDLERDTKVYGETAIPAGRYKVLLTMSARFKRVLPLLVNVPNYEGVRIHPGNKPEDTEGCILVGTSVVNQDFIGNSRVAFDSLYAKMTAAVAAKQEIWIEVCSTRT